MYQNIFIRNDFFITFFQEEEAFINGYAINSLVLEC